MTSLITFPGAALSLLKHSAAFFLLATGGERPVTGPASYGSMLSERYLKPANLQSLLEERQASDRQETLLIQNKIILYYYVFVTIKNKSH